MSDRALYEQDVVRRVLALREDLVRHDENDKAWKLLDACVPYFLLEHPEIVSARADQREMVLHLLEPDAYGAYYASNRHERPFEEQYGMSVEEAHRLPRIGFLRGCLAEQHSRVKRRLSVLDLAGNDGFMAANLSALGYVTTDCVDLHPGNCALAEKRRAEYAGIGHVECCDCMTRRRC